MEENVMKVRKEGGVELMKASAGSGKTFSLAREYIRLLLNDSKEDPNAHRGILAVTFTNKATGEMKERIIKELDKLSRDPLKSDYCRYLLSECDYGDDMCALSRDASKALTCILNDYGSFSVMTIDKFFQRTLRAFAREIGMYNEYTVELDKESLVDETVDRVLDSLSDEDDSLLEWLSSNSIESMGEGEGYHLDANLRGFAKGYMSASHDAKVKKLSIDEQLAFSQDNLEKLKSIVNTVVSKYYSGLGAALKRVEVFLGPNDDVLGKNVPGGLEKVRRFVSKKSDKLEFSRTLENVCNDGKKAYKAEYYKKMPESEISATESCFNELRAFCTGPVLKEFNTARIIKKQISMFRVADRLRNEFEILMAEKGVVCLDNTNEYIRKLVGDKDDVPFVYEKLGVRYRHFLLDEFQDTSVIQWENFLPLLRESVDNGYYNLVVGDVKQSIYRWRDADWRIIDSLDRSGEPMAAALRVAANPLGINFRSADSIVKFNNDFYERVASQMDLQLCFEEGQRSVGSIYKDVSQKTGKDFKVPGSVEVTFCDKKDGGRDVVEMTVDVVRDALENRSFDKKDIAVLVRSNVIGSRVAVSLIEAGIPVVSGDSLKICSSPAVRKAVACLFKIDNEKDSVNSYDARDIDVSGIRARSLYEMSELALRAVGRDDVDTDTPYVGAFMDIVREFEARNGNSLHSFLSFWQEDGAKRCIASPKDSDAVTVITIHKSKGLDFPFVVFPVSDRDLIVSGLDSSWEDPDLGETSFRDAIPALYNVGLTDSLKNTCFEKRFSDEKKMMFIDNINIWYVATTRASQALHIVSPLPSSDTRKAVAAGLGGSWPEIKKLPDVLYLYAVADNKMQKVQCDGAERYLFGEISCKEEVVREPVNTASYSYYGEEELCDFRGSLRVKSDAGKFFEDGFHSGYESSRRVRGIVLHGILEKVVSPADLKSAVKSALLSGLLDAEEAEKSEALLSDAIESVSSRGWFPEDASKVIVERDIADEKGKCVRPDRVILTKYGVDIVDYKFGDEEDQYGSQVGNYAYLYRKMGFENVTPYIWYVEEGKIVKIS